MRKNKHQYIGATITNECTQISSNIAGYIRNQFKPLDVDNDDFTHHIATVAQLTLTMQLLTTPQLPLHAAGSPNCKFQNQR